MNSNRRKQLQAIREELQDIYERLDILCDEEWAAYDNLPEPFQDSERGEKMQSAISTLESVRDQVSEALMRSAKFGSRLVSRERGGVVRSDAGAGSRTTKRWNISET